MLLVVFNCFQLYEAEQQRISTTDIKEGHQAMLCLSVSLLSA